MTEDKTLHELARRVRHFSPSGAAGGEQCHQQAQGLMVPRKRRRRRLTACLRDAPF